MIAGVYDHARMLERYDEGFGSGFSKPWKMM